MITTLVYRDHKLSAHNPPVESLAALRKEPGVMLWIDLAAPTPEEIKAIFEDLFAFHPLVIEDCVSDSPLPKLEAYDDYLDRNLSYAEADYWAKRLLRTRDEQRFRSEVLGSNEYFTHA